MVRFSYIHFILTSLALLGSCGNVDEIIENDSEIPTEVPILIQFDHTGIEDSVYIRKMNPFYGTESVYHFPLEVDSSVQLSELKSRVETGAEGLMMELEKIKDNRYQFNFSCRHWAYPDGFTKERKISVTLRDSIRDTLTILQHIVHYDDDTLKIPMRLNDSLLHLVRHEPRQPKMNTLYLIVHEDEQTSIEVIRDYAETNTINYAYLEQSAKRRIAFNVDSSTYSIDPNRIFSPVGRDNTLEGDSTNKQEAQALSTKLANGLIGVVNQYSYIVTLHNNSPNRYSIKSYKPGGGEAGNTGDLHINSKEDPDDFFYTTDSTFFKVAKEANYNVILQDNSDPVDDGSLSVFCGWKGVPYINIEAELGHFDKQREMLDFVAKFLSTKLP